jgi:myo-inositol 2-dehydrogenase/D-chiro-inositol 1-dehydrogenase
MLRFGILGTGRIGDMHAGLVAIQPDATVTWCYDVDIDRAKATADKVRARATTDVDKLLSAENADAVLIASPTITHVELILRSAEAGKAILCEKPIDLDINKVEECGEALKSFDVPCNSGPTVASIPAMPPCNRRLRAARSGLWNCR